MLHLLWLPIELQLEIYRSLTNIDDALHLARTCKSLNAIFENTCNRCSIFRSIIQNGFHHKYDLHLHASEDRYAAFVGNYDNGRLPDYNSRPLIQGIHQVGPGDTKLSADVVWSIVCRWHAMKVLFDLYCDSNIRPFYISSDLPYQPSEDFETTEWLAELADECPLPFPSCRDIRPLQAARKQQAYELFYRGLSSQWVTINELWLARRSRYPTTTIQREVFSKISEYWHSHPARSLREKIEVVEVTDFVWDFLGRKIFQGPDDLPHWLLGAEAEERYLEEALLVDLEQIGEDATPAGYDWLEFVREVLVYIRPPQIIELLNNMWNPRPKPFDRAYYIHGLGLFDFGSRNGFPEVTEGRYSPPKFCLRDLEAEAIDACVEQNIGHRAYHMTLWEEYRYTRWGFDFRGRALFYPQPSNSIRRRMRDIRSHIIR